MKKYVSKQDVEKGLVDPNKPLNEQKDYLDKIEKQQDQEHKPKDKPQYRKKRERENRPKYNWNRRDVTQDTVIPEAPKKQVPKPDKDKFFEKLNAMKKQIEDLNKKKSDLIQELKSTMRNTSDNKKNTRTVKSKYSAIFGQKNSEKKSLQEDMKLLQEKRDDIEREFNGLKEKINSLRKPDSFDDCSSEELQKRLEKTEQKLTTADLSKKQQNQINMRIVEIKRALQKSKSDVEINAEVGKLQDQNDLLYRQLKQVKATISQKYGQLVAVKAEIASLNEELNQEKVEPEDTRTAEEIKADFDKKIDQVNQQKQKIKKQIDTFREAHDKKLDEYEDYNDLISYINMVKEEKEKIKAWKAEQQRKKKEKQEAEKKRQQQYEQRQKRREQKIKKDEERRKQAQERKQKLQKEREQYINRNPHHQKIDLCKTLVEYCESLKPENAEKKLEKREQKVAQPILELKPADSKDWQKELKKGAQVIVSKKLREEQETPKKVVKQKKKKQKEPNESTSGFTHHIDTARMFEKVNILPPLTAAQIDQTIKFILQKIELFSKPTEQQIKAYKQKAQKQFDSLHGFDEQRGTGPRKTGNYRERNYDEKVVGGHRERDDEHQEGKRHQEKDKRKQKRAEKTQIVATEKDFPGLG